jgi:hypothetical protein
VEPEPQRAWLAQRVQPGPDELEAVLAQGQALRQERWEL